LASAVELFLQLGVGGHQFSNDRLQKRRIIGVDDWANRGRGRVLAHAVLDAPVTEGFPRDG
jgi:hypothetical protein